MRCWCCRRTETLRVRSLPQGKALLFALCLLLGAGMGSVLRPLEHCHLHTWGNTEETDSVTFPLPGLKGFGQG